MSKVIQELEGELRLAKHYLTEACSNLHTAYSTDDAPNKAWDNARTQLKQRQQNLEFVEDMLATAKKYLTGSTDAEFTYLMAVWFTRDFGAQVDNYANTHSRTTKTGWYTRISEEVWEANREANGMYTKKFPQRYLNLVHTGDPSKEKTNE